MPSFFDGFVDEGAGAYVNADEKQILIDNGTTFPIVSLRTEDHEKYGERYIATVALPTTDEDGDETEEERLISFPRGTVDSRDRMLEAMEKWLEDPANEPPLVKLEKVGRSILVRNAG